MINLPRRHLKSEHTFQGADAAFWVNFPVLTDDMHSAHDHDFAEIALITAGHGKHLSIYCETKLARGDCVILMPGAWHSYRVPECLEVANCCFRPALLRNELTAVESDSAIAGLLDPAAWGSLKNNSSSSVQLKLRALLFDRALECIHLIHQHQNAREPAAFLERRGYFLLLLGLISRALSSDERAVWESAALWPQSIRQCVGLIEKDLARMWTLPQLATSVHLDPSYLGRLFRRHLGETPFEYIARRRMERAASLLLSTSLSVTEIGAQTGVEPPSYFARRFRQHFACSASNYRRKKRSENKDIQKI
jgi:AraC family L-rhamnose operon transcriptional activator RhaR